MLLALFILLAVLFGGHFIIAIFTGILFHPLSIIAQIAVAIVLVHLGRKLIDTYVTK